MEDVVNDMEDVMADLETLGTTAGCVILSIGAVGFDNENIGHEFYVVISVRSCLDAGLTINPDTLEWWQNQNEEAKTILQLVKSNTATPLKTALIQFNDFLSQYKNVKVWGNGAAFDNAILRYAYAAVGVKQHWEFWNDMCYRTVKAMNPEVKFKRVGTYHNALDDAKSQALHFIEIMKQM